MRNLIQISLVLWLISAAATQAQTTQPEAKALQVYDWKEVRLQPRPVGSEIFLTNGISVLKIENNNTPLEVRLLTITNASLIAKATSISCEMKYENVGEIEVAHTNAVGFKHLTSVSSHLFLLESIPPEVLGGDESTNTQGFYFNGTENWKPYQLSVGSVFRTTGETFPTQLALNLYLPTHGTVYLRPIKLLGGTSTSGNWWSPQQAGLVGGIGGTLIGCFGGLIGLLVSKGRARKFVLATVKCCIALGVFLMIAGLVAVVLQQPYAVWYSLLLPGVILILVFSLNLHSIQRRYDELEIRRMTSIDATGS